MSTQTTHVTPDGAPVIPWWTLGDRIRKARSTANMDQREFAEALGVPAGSLAGWETDRQRPRDLVAVAKRIEMLTRIPAAWILGLDVAQPGPTPGGAAAAGWAPWGSNPQPADSTSVQVTEALTATIVQGPWPGSGEPAAARAEPVAVAQ
jgi:transcriptional regulator with XRE-family HTH domain